MRDSDDNRTVIALQAVQGLYHPSKPDSTRVALLTIKGEIEHLLVALDRAAK